MLESGKLDKRDTSSCKNENTSSGDDINGTDLVDKDANEKKEKTSVTHDITEKDSGWAWIIALATSLHVFLLVGFAKSFGLFFVQFIDVYGTSSSMTSVIIAVQTLVTSISSLFVLNIGTKMFSIQAIIIIGAILSSAGYMLNAFSPSITFLVFSHGIVYDIMLRQDILTLSLLPPVSPFSESSNSSTDELIRVASQRTMASQQQYTSMVSDGSQSDNSDISATTVSTTQSMESVKSNQTSATTKPSYQRHPKPPYSYLGMIIMAIEMSPDKALSLSEIHLSLVSMFPFFRGTYRGWKDSVRHTLSSGACFFKCLRGRINKWAVHLHLAPYNALLRQDTAVSRSSYWPPTIYDYLDVPEVMLPTKYNTASPSATTSDNILQTKRPTDFSIDRILTPEIADDSRPLLTDETSPTFNKMKLKLKTRKTTTRRHQSSPLTKLVTDSATKWGVTEETTVDQLRSLCKIMDTTSALQQHQASEQLLLVKSELPSPSLTDTSNHSPPSDLQESSSYRYQLPTASVPSCCLTQPSIDYQSQACQQNLSTQSYTTSQHHQLYTTEYFQQLYAAHQYQQQLYTQQLYQQQLAAQQYVYHPSFQGYQQNGFFQVPADFNTLAVDLPSPSCQ